jgi:hypothetical protein
MAILNTSHVGQNLSGEYLEHHFEYNSISAFLNAVSGSRTLSH